MAGGLSCSPRRLADQNATNSPETLRIMILLRVSQGAKNPGVAYRRPVAPLARPPEPPLLGLEERF
jgi:hypothetical protein